MDPPAGGLVEGGAAEEVAGALDVEAGVLVGDAVALVATVVGALAAVVLGAVALVVGAAEEVADCVGATLAVGAGNCSTGFPARAASMNAFHSAAGTVPPVTCEQPHPGQAGMCWAHRSRSAGRGRRRWTVVG